MSKKKIIIIVVVGLIVIASLASFGSGKNKKSDSGSKSQARLNTESKDESESKEASKNRGEEKTEFRVGDTFENDGLKVTYVSSGDYESDNMFIQPADDKKFIRLYFLVENESGSDQNVSSFDFTCYADGYECDSKYLDDSLSASLSNGRTGEGALYFEVSKDAKEIEIEYDYKLFGDKKVKFIYEGDKDSGIKIDKKAEASADAYNVGDVIEMDKLKITYKDAGEYTSDNQFLQPKEGNRYIYIELEVENKSDSDKTISYFSFDCYADGTKCEQFYGMDDNLSATLSSGRSAKGTVAFEVPMRAEVIEIEYEDNIWTENKIVFNFKD